MDAKIMFAQAFGTGNEISTLVQSEFFAYALPFLFAFAVVYGLLSHVGEKGLPEDKHSRVVIALASGFLVLPIAPSLVGILSTVSSGLVVGVGALLILVILFELLGVRSSKKVPVLEGGKHVGYQDIPMSIFEAHNKMFLALLAIIAVLIFANAGWFSALGLPTPDFLFNSPLILFVIFMIAIVAWVSRGEQT
ncbi:MAG: hypothetical protein HYS81_01210 [Candidatus Aenigmatarchaeota archaeon]|nr:MAG: hypothetical protein HYS81_01210 [Candidatus Aenigmarchaeota archaeon]